MQRRWKEVKEYMDSEGASYDYVWSEGFGSVERLVGILANNGYRITVIVGGDGALNDAINGTVSSNAEKKDEVATGATPNGTGNDFARYRELNLEYKQTVDWTIGSRRKKIDVGYCNFYDGEKRRRRYPLNVTNIGLGTRIIKIADQTKRFRGIRFPFCLVALFLLIFERKLYRPHLKISDEHIRSRIVIVCVGSTTGYGQTPSAVPYNGRLDISVVYRLESPQMISGFWMLTQGRILNYKIMKPYRTREVRVLRA